MTNDLIYIGPVQSHKSITLTTGITSCSVVYENPDLFNSHVEIELFKANFNGNVTKEKIRLKINESHKHTKTDLYFTSDEAAEEVHKSKTVQMYNAFKYFIDALKIWILTKPEIQKLSSTYMKYTNMLRGSYPQPEIFKKMQPYLWKFAKHIPQITLPTIEQ